MRNHQSTRFNEVNVLAAHISSSVKITFSGRWWYIVAKIYSYGRYPRGAAHGGGKTTIRKAWAGRV